MFIVNENNYLWVENMPYSEWCELEIQSQKAINYSIKKHFKNKKMSVNVLKFSPVLTKNFFPIK